MRRASFLLLLCGCPVPVQPPVQRPYPPPTAQQLLQAVNARQEKLTSLRAEGKADEMQGGERVKVTTNVLVARGGKLRLEFESPLGGTVATLVTDGSQFQLLDTRNNRFLTGPAEPCNVARLIGVELEPDQVMTVVTGSAPVEGEPVDVGWDTSHGGRDILTLKTPDGGTETLWLSNRAWDVAAAERKDASGRTLWKVTHEDFQDDGGFRFPKRTAVEQPLRKADVRVRWKNREANPAVKDAAFHLEPGGLRVETVGCR